jgi:hypothetical protein
MEVPAVNFGARGRRVKSPRQAWRVYEKSRFSPSGVSVPVACHPALSLHANYSAKQKGRKPAQSPGFKGYYFHKMLVNLITT